jgi:hypothetical protein
VTVLLGFTLEIAALFVGCQSCMQWRLGASGSGDCAVFSMIAARELE